MSLPERLARILADRRRRDLTSARAVPCAVLVPILPRAGAFSVVYTLRSEHLPNHKGQVAFPGGKHSNGEDTTLLETALREAREEVDIVPKDVDILGKLDDVCTMAGEFVITPYVGLLPEDYAFRANPGEVDDIFDVPVSSLLDPVHHDIEQREWRGANHTIQVITAGRHKIWGATRLITANLIECVEDSETDGG